MVAVERDGTVPPVAGEESSRARILRVARALFTEQGFAAVSMQQIADDATINKATLYHHFRDKEDLFVSVMREEFARVSASVTASIDEGGSLREQLRRVGAQVIAARRSDFGRLFADMRAHVSDQTRALLMETCLAPWEPLRVAIDRAMQAGEVRQVDAELVARMYFVMVGSQIWWTRFGATGPDPDAELAATLADLLLDGIASTGEVLTPASPAD